MSEFIAFIVGALFGAGALVCYALCAAKGGDNNE